MPFKETCVMDERMAFLLAARAGEESFASICRRHGISRRVGYKWLDRYAAEGPAGLHDRSRAPLSHPQAMGGETAQACLEVRRAHPSWGPLKVRAYLKRQRPAKRWPAASTIGELFDREGLTVKRRLARHAPPAAPISPFGALTAPHEVWCIDFKGWFLTGDGARCEPMTLSDAYSRYLLRCQVLARNDAEHVWSVLAAAFRQFGLPERLRSDNGAPFASCGAGGLTKLGVRLIKAGVVPERIKPGKPQQNGRLERLHWTLINEAASPPAHTLAAQARQLARFMRLYNDERPHQALGGDVPADHFRPSLRRFDGVLREPQYPPDLELRRVRSNGEIKWQGKLVYLNQALAGEPVGLAEQPDGDAIAHYGPVTLGRIPYQAQRLIHPQPETCGLVDGASPRPQGPQPQPQLQTNT
jgi:transposase InsO family protein